MRERTLAVAGVIEWFVIVIVGLACAAPGCKYVGRIGDAIFNKPLPLPGNVIPETPKVQLWETIKGMTPNWLAIPVIALGAVAMFNGAAKLGMSCIIFGSVNLFMALATSRFGFWMALCGLIGSLAAVVASMVAKSKAIKDIVGNLQTIKETAKEDDVDIVFQDKLRDELNHQLTSTKKIVAKVKAKIWKRKED